MTRATLTLTHLARLGFVELDWAHDALEGLPSGLADSFSVSADSDLALRGVLTLHERAPEMLARVLAKLDADGNAAVSWAEFKSAFLLYQLSALEKAAIWGGA